MPRVVTVLLAVVVLAGPATAVPGAPEALEWRGVGRSSALRWFAPAGDPAVSYEVRGSELPIDTFDSASGALVFYPTSGSRPAGVLEFRELDEVEVAEDEELPTVLKTALYFAVRGVDAGGGVGPAATTGGFQVTKVRVKTDRSGAEQLVLKARFSVRRDVLDVPSGDLRVRIVQDDVTVLDATVPASAFPSGGAHKVKDKTGPLRLVQFKSGQFALLTVKTNRSDLVLAPGDITVLVDLGARPFSADVTLREKGRKLLFP